MKKFLNIFLIGQMLLFSIIFNQSVYQIYSLNNMGDSSLSPYKIEEPTADNLSRFYEYYKINYLDNKEGKLQIIKMPVTNSNIVEYEIYHSQVKEIIKLESVSEDKLYNYYDLKEDDFIDSIGVFYTDLDSEEIEDLSSQLQINIKEYKEIAIDYIQIIKYNLFNFIMLIILSSLILFIYTVLKNKTNAIKKILGYSPSKIMVSQIAEFFKSEVKILVFISILHFIYYFIINRLVSVYFLGLVMFLLTIIILNILLVFLTQTWIKHIDINSAIKNRLYSNKLNYLLQFIKITLIFSVVISSTNFVADYKEYKNTLEELDRYKKLAGFYTSYGLNSQEHDRLMQLPQELKINSDNVKEMYNIYRKENKAILISSDVFQFGENYLEEFDITIEEILDDYETNNIVLNEKYINEFMNLKTEDKEYIKNIDISSPTILVPEKYKNQEKEVKRYFKDQYESYLNYDKYYKIDIETKKIDSIDIIYLENNQTYDLLGRSEDNNEIILKDSVILIDYGEFSGSYYLDLLGNSKISFKLSDKMEFDSALDKYGLNKLLSSNTLLTPYLQSMSSAKFVMNQAFYFSILFFVTLLFIIYISNYIYIIVNKKKLAVKQVIGFSKTKSLNINIIVLTLLFLLAIPMYILNLNIVIYLGILLVDIIFLYYLYNQIIKKDISTIMKGA